MNKEKTKYVLGGFLLPVSVSENRVIDAMRRLVKRFNSVERAISLVEKLNRSIER